MARTLSADLASRGIKPWQAFEWYSQQPLEVPSIVEFVLSDKYLNRPYIFPRQLTLLKVITLQTELFTSYDEDVIAGWATEFEHTENHGIVPDIEQRLKMARDEGRPWFRENVVAIGRRGSKGFMGGLVGSYVTYNYMSKGDPHSYYGVDRDKQFANFVFAGKREQAKVNQWRDIVNVILGAPCFTPYISNSLGETLSLFAPSDFRKMLERERRGIETSMDPATFIIQPKESTPMAARGPASFSLFFDEMAHVVSAGANRSAAEVYESAVPSLDQFKQDAFMYEGSSTWQKIGQFFENYEKALKREDGKPVYPEMFMCQLTSWDPYEDWEQATDLRVEPGGPYFQPLKGPIQEYDEQMERLERSNPETFAVERRSHFQTVLDAYLREAKVLDAFKPWNGQELVQQTSGVLSKTYKAHGDPARSGDRFGFAIGHTEPDPEDPEVKHVVFDVIHAWDPSDFPDHTIDYEDVYEDIWSYVTAFHPFELTFDQWSSAAYISRLQRDIRKANFPKKVDVYEHTATLKSNWEKAEVFKTALNMGWVHFPPGTRAAEILELELKFLREVPTSGLHGKIDHPDTGPVTTKDVADAVMDVVYTLLADQVVHIRESLGAVRPSPSQQGGLPVREPEEESVFSALSTAGRGRGLASGSPARSGRPRR